ncbi:hypothetical protein ACFSJS_02730 [Streptomyces desertarenae]|uniref:Uncharacterized protein n=1 Tax=Streptomyces desertarenae TaxID=2666184 RepID=A0ABW4PF79_9ACTN
MTVSEEEFGQLKSKVDKKADKAEVSGLTKTKEFKDAVEKIAGEKAKKEAERSFLPKIENLKAKVDSLEPQYGSIKTPEIMGLALALTLIKYDLAIDITDRVNRLFFGGFNRVAARFGFSPNLKTQQQKAEEQQREQERKVTELGNRVTGLEGKARELERKAVDLSTEGVRTRARLRALEGARARVADVPGGRTATFGSTITGTSEHVNQLNARIDALVAALA